MVDLASTLRSESSMSDNQWESEVAALLNRLSHTQERLLDLLNRKRELLLQRDRQGLSNLVVEEQRLCAELQACQDLRQNTLALASAAGLPAASIRQLVGNLPGESQQPLRQSVDAAQQRAHLLRHHCMSQWVAMQRTVLHLSHLIEILATGGQIKPTYGRRGTALPSGALMDQAG
jgi:hypothetical protein